MKGALLVRQKGEGCDYTIACGKNWYVIEGKDSGDVTLNALTRLLEDGFCSPTTDQVLDIVLLVIDGQEINLNQAYANYRRSAAQQESDAQARIARDNELAELARLQAKYTPSE